MNRTAKKYNVTVFDSFSTLKYREKTIPKEKNTKLEEIILIITTFGIMEG